MKTELQKNISSARPLIGHQKIYENLEQQFRQGRLPHALLFVGLEGIGKKKLAFKLSQILLGLAENEAPLLLEGKHPDFIWIRPENKRIKMDSIRALLKQLRFSPFQSQQRVILIEDAHCMNSSAANALLKSLEEPKAGNYFILISHALGWIPKTVISRTQKIYFPPLKEQEIGQILEQENIVYSPEQLNSALGSPLKYMQRQVLFSQGLQENFHMDKIFSSEAPLSFGEAARLSEGLVKEGQIEVFLEMLLEKVHQGLTQSENLKQNAFDDLTFAERVLDLRKHFNLNLNMKMHVTRLLLYFQESKKSRL